MERFDTCFLRVMQAFAAATSGVMAIDGKPLRQAGWSDEFLARLPAQTPSGQMR